MLGSLARYFWAGTPSTNEKRDMDNLLAASEEDGADEKKKKKRQLAPQNAERALDTRPQMKKKALT